MWDDAQKVCTADYNSINLLKMIQEFPADFSYLFRASQKNEIFMRRIFLNVDSLKVDPFFFNLRKRWKNQGKKWNKSCTPLLNLGA